jgi:hypothetical protein
MNTSPASPAAGRRSPDDESGDRSDMELDMMFALDPLDEAIDVAFAAVEAAQQAARTIPETAAPAKFRDEWRTHNVLVRQTLRLVDERVQELIKAIRRLPRSG